MSCRAMRRLPAPSEARGPLVAARATLRLQMRIARMKTMQLLAVVVDAALPRQSSAHVAAAVLVSRARDWESTRMKTKTTSPLAAEQKASRRLEAADVAVDVRVPLGARAISWTMTTTTRTTRERTTSLAKRARKLLLRLEAAAASRCQRAGEGAPAQMTMKTIWTRTATSDPSARGLYHRRARGHFAAVKSRVQKLCRPTQTRRSSPQQVEQRLNEELASPLDLRRALYHPGTGSAESDSTFLTRSPTKTMIAARAAQATAAQAAAATKAPPSNERAGCSIAWR